MEIALLVTITLGIIAVLLFLENDKLKKSKEEERKSQEDRIYKLSVLKEIQEKIAYTKDAEKVVDIIMAELRNFFPYSVAGSMVIKDARVIFKAYVDEEVSNDYIAQIEEKMLSSFSKFVGNMPDKIDRKVYGIPLNDAVKSTYSSSFHTPLIANNKVLALIHLSSTKENAYKDMSDLNELIDAAASSLTSFNQAIETENYISTQLIKSISDGIFMVDNKSNLLIINEAAKRIFGFNHENINFFDIANVFAKDFNLESKVNEVLATNTPFIEKDIQIKGGVFNVFVNTVSNDKASIVLHDMTAYKKSEMLKEDLTHIMVHELRAPVTTIKDSAELIISAKDTLEEGRKLKFLEMIHQQAKKVLGQIGSILDTAKLDAGKLVLQKTKGDVAKVIQDEIQTFMPQAQRKNISLSFEILAKLPEIYFDEIRISQAIDNLLSNSLKFTAENGTIKVEVDYKAIPPVVDGSSPMGEFLSLDKFIVVSVSDNGVGIAKEQQKFLFSKYTQAKNTPEALSTLGTGLGLYLVKGIVESHGGRIWVKSAQGVGTTFSFSLPATDDAKASYDAPNPATTPLSKLSQTVN